MPFVRAVRHDREVGGDRGFTLVETLVAISLLTLVGGGATTGVVASIRAQNDNEWRTAASNLVRADIDSARAVQYPAYPKAAASRPVAVGGKTFAVQRTVVATNGASGGCPDVITSTGVLSLTVTSTATWNNGRGKVTMATVVTC